MHIKPIAGRRCFRWTSVHKGLNCQVQCRNTGMARRCAWRGIKGGSSVIPVAVIKSSDSNLGEEGFIWPTIPGYSSSLQGSHRSRNSRQLTIHIHRQEQRKMNACMPSIQLTPSQTIQDSDRGLCRLLSIKTKLHKHAYGPSSSRQFLIETLTKSRFCR